MSDSTFLVQEFDHDSVMLFIGTFTSLEPEIRNGRFRFYNNEGKVEVAGFYYHDIPYGKWVYYDDNGKITRVLDYKSVLDFLSENRDETTELASGAADSMLSCSVGCTMEETRDTVYVSGPVPTFRGGDPSSITSYIKDHAVYPVYAKDKGISGCTVIRFTLNGEGKISTASVLSGESPDLNMEAMRVLLESEGWEPATTVEGDPPDIIFTIRVRL